MSLRVPFGFRITCVERVAPGAGFVAEALALGGASERR
jgi:hypothetical protein